MGSLRFSIASLRIPPTGGTQYAPIKSSGLATAPTVTGYTSWVTAAINTDATMLSVTAGNNSTGAERSTQVRITARDTLGQTLFADLTVIQEAAEDGQIVLAQDTVNIPPAGSAFGVPYTISGLVTNISATTSRAWITNVRVTASAVQFTVAQNKTGDFRQGVITITGTTNGHTTTAALTVNQESASVESEIRTPDYATFTKNGGSNIITPTLINCAGLSANTTSTSWLTVSSDGIHVTVTATANTGDERRGHIALYATKTTGGIISKEVIIVQARGNTQPVGIIQPSISILQVPGDATTGRFAVTYDYIDTSTRAVSCDQDWLIATIAAGGAVVWQSETYTGETQRTATLTISAKGTDGRNVSATVSVVQMPAQEFVRFPIWRDEYGMIPDVPNEYAYYRLTTDGEVLYNGRGYVYDGYVRVHLNDIMSDRVIPTLNIGQNGIQENGGICHFDLETSYDGQNYTVFAPYMTYYDWSYDSHDLYTDYFISNPIDYRLDPRQKMVATVRNLTTNDMTFQAVGASTYYTTVSNSFATAVVPVGDVNTVQINVQTPIYYRLADGCARYCLYYLNRKGGWDSFLFNRESTEQDKVTNSIYRREMPNTTYGHARVMYQKEAVKGWTLKSRYLNDKEAKNFATNLLESTQAYLHDLESGDIYPVYIDNGSVNYYDYWSNGHKLIRYDVDVILAQIRRVR